MPEWNYLWEALNGGEVFPDEWMSQSINQLAELRALAESNRIKWEPIERIEREIRGVCGYVEKVLSNYLRHVQEEEYLSFDIRWLTVSYLGGSLFRLTIDYKRKTSWWWYAMQFFEAERIPITYKWWESKSRSISRFHLFFQLKTIIPELIERAEKSK